MNKFKNYLKNFFKGHERTVKAKKHILASLFIKGVSILVSLIIVPLILGYLDAERYGVWLTLSSILGWFSFFDIGLGNGLRNRLAEAFARNDKLLAKTYVSTTYYLLGVIFLVVLVLFLIVNPFISWQAILNTKAVSENELKIIAAIVFVFFIARLFFKLIGNILLADQRPAINNSFGPIGNLIILVLIFILTKTVDSSLLALSIVMSMVPAFILLSANVFFFRTDYKEYKPSLKNVDLRKSGDLLTLGLKFFFIRIAFVVFYSTSNFLIAHFSSQKTVAAYNIAYKYFFLVNMIFSIILTPFWAATTDAITRQDFQWIKNAIKKLMYISFGGVAVIVVLLVFSDVTYRYWVGNKVSIPFNLSLSVAIYLGVTLIIAPFSTLINGFGKLKISMWILTVKLFTFLPIAFLLGEKFGAVGIVSSIIIIQLPSLFVGPYQVYLILNQKARGIWNK